MQIHNFAGPLVSEPDSSALIIFGLIPIIIFVPILYFVFKKLLKKTYYLSKTDTEQYTQPNNQETPGTAPTDQEPPLQ